MGGIKTAPRLNAAGLDCGTVDKLTIAVGDLSFPPVGHVLYNPRCKKPIKPEMVADIKANGVREEITIQEKGIVNGKMVIWVLNGTLRTVHGKVAEQELVEEGNTIRLTKGKLRVPARLWTGTDEAFLMERLRANTDPLKEPDAPSVLAITCIQLDKFMVSIDTMATVMPKHISKREISALLRWNNLSVEAQDRFDAGAPLGLLEEVLNAPREEQVACLDKLIAAGISAPAGVTRLKNRAKREEAARGGTVVSDRLRSGTVTKLVEALRPHTSESFATEDLAVALQEQISSGEKVDVEALLFAYHDKIFADGLLAGLQASQEGRVALGPAPDHLKAIAVSVLDAKATKEAEKTEKAEKKAAKAAKKAAKTTVVETKVSESGETPKRRGRPPGSGKKAVLQIDASALG